MPSGPEQFHARILPNNATLLRDESVSVVTVGRRAPCAAVVDDAARPASASACFSKLTDYTRCAFLAANLVPGPTPESAKERPCLPINRGPRVFYGWYRHRVGARVLGLRIRVGRRTPHR